MADYDKDPMEEANASENSEEIAGEAALKGTRDSASKPLSFKEAFASARKGGDKTFEWNGGKYATEMESSAKKAAPVAPVRANSDYSNEGRTTPKPPLRQVTMRDNAEAPKKEMYRTMSGKMAEKTPDKNPAAGLGDLISRGAKAAGETLSKYEFVTPASRIAKENKAAKEARGYKAGGSVSSASRRGDGIAMKGKTRGKMC